MCVYVYICMQTRVSSFVLCQNACGVVNEQKIFCSDLIYRYR